MFFTRLGSVTGILLSSISDREALALKKGRWPSGRIQKLSCERKIGPGWRRGIRWGEAVASDAPVLRRPFRRRKRKAKKSIKSAKYRHRCSETIESAGLAL
ncbi:hypothetical protein AVEN_141657-1 [Araneus ventricosus]|uniref:Uncharacterized protein n=1 Tax=Araneus ventricosus TaxID=182803 RepID=A0A4Y2IQR4_ARAVE|nr:hypothetical protein AVEN_141657-1 [Araneus ventricosus]